VRDAAHSLDADLPIFDVKTMAEHLGITLYPARLASTVLGFLGALALALAAIGLYGVVAFAVTQRTKEIGVRMAVGASPADVLRLVIGQGMRLALLGLGIGLALAIAATRLIQSLLFGLSPTDPLTLAAIALLLLAVTVLASWIPARRAARVDPMLALHHE
jgi:ABC-type antimicrobial peptide transport system permease subunit